MSRKRGRKGGGRSQRWDALPWKTVEPPLERDDGWQGMAGEEQALLYTLEEISGSDYCLREDSLGGSQMVVAPTTPSAEDKPPAAQDSAAAAAAGGNGKGGDAGDAGGKMGRKRKASSALAAASEGGSSNSSTEGGTASSWTNGGAKGAEEDAGGDDGNAAVEGGGAEKTTGDGDGDGERDASNKGPKKKKRRGQGKKKRAAEARAATAAAAAAPAAVAAAGSTSSLGDGGGSTTAAAVDDAGGPGAPPPPASVAAAGQKQQQQQQQQQQHAGEQTAEAAAAVAEKGKTKPKATTNKKKKKKKKKKARGGGEDGEEAAEVGQKKSERDWELGAEEAAKMAPWMYLGVELHPALLWHLHRQGFHDPTPIQRRVLPKALLGRKDIIGAAETGSGKTLAFGLPVLSEILTRRDAAAAAKLAEGGEADQGEGEEEEGEGLHEGLQALVLCPTRELALQVAAHLREVVRDTGVAVVAVVGGLAEVKQQRQLSRRPEVVVATPGRFWEMAGTHAHLSRLETLRHLVVDEADRMLERGHYPELSRLFSMLAKAEGRQEGGGGGSSSKSRFKNKFPFDVSEGGEWSVPQEEDEDEDEEEDEGSGESGKMFDDAIDESGDGDVGGADRGGLSGGASRVRPPLRAAAAETKRPGGRGFARQTYVFSATLTLGSSGRQQRKKGAAAAAAAKGKKGKKGEGDDDAVKKIMDRVGVRGG